MLPRNLQNQPRDDTTGFSVIVTRISSVRSRLEGGEQAAVWAR